MLGASGANPRYVGGDISLLPDYENAKATYYDNSGKKISDVLTFCYDEGMNAMRVRLFVNPSDYTGSDKDSNAKQDLEYIIPLCKRIVDDGFALMLDFHYSDTWADPGKQWTPKAWEGLNDGQLYLKIQEYTKETLETLKSNGIVPAFIQTGNEISYGMLWGPYGTSSPKKVHYSSDANWQRLGNLLNFAIKACREVCPEAKIVIHTERVAQVNVLKDFYTRMENLKVDYDIIGLSYYPYFHGDMNVLDNALTTLENEFPEKSIMIVETGYPYKWEVPGTTHPNLYPLTEDGQDKFARELVETLLKHDTVDGLFWWWMEYNAKGTTLSGWYNAPLFDSQTGRATKALKTICGFGTGHENSGLLPVAADMEDGFWYDLMGRRVGEPTAPGLYIHNGRKILVP